MSAATPLTDYSTQSARADELRRRKLRKAMAAQWAAIHGQIDADKLESMRVISDAEWKAANDEGLANAA